MDLHKISKIGAIVLGLLGIVFAFLSISSEKGSEDGVVGIFIIVAYVAFLLALGSVLAFVVLNFLKSKDKKYTLISLGAFAAVVLIAFILADGTEVVLKDGEVISSGFSKFVSTFLNTFYIMAILAVASLVYSSFGKLKK